MFFSLQKLCSRNSYIKLMVILSIGATLSNDVNAADTVLEAETAFLNNAEVNTTFSGFTGTGYVKLSSPDNDDKLLTYSGYDSTDFKNQSYLQWNNIIDTSSCIPSCDLELKIRYLVEKNIKPTVTVFSVNKNKVIATKRFEKDTGNWEERSWLIHAVKDEPISIRIVAASKTVFIDRMTVETPQFLIRPGNIVPSEDVIEFGQPGYENTYYGKVDPFGRRTTLKKWKEVNGFDKYGAYVIRAQYINSHDLGFGRDMNCINNFRISCYVDNYLEPNSSNPEFAATVTMEKMQYRDPITKTSRRITAFFVYNDKGERIDRIALDNEGPKAVPESCYSCHKGYTDANGNPQGGQYLPWDINLLDQFPGKPTLAKQLDQFRRLNKIVWREASVQYFDTNDGLTKYRKQSVKDLIEGWYGGSPYIGTFFNNDNLPKDSWYSKIPDQNIPAENCATVPLPEACRIYFKERFLYKNVYAEYCRTCHVSQGDGQDVKKPTDTNTIGLDWDKGMAFWNAAYSAVCSNVNPLSLMPHAEVTYNRFATDAINFTDGTSATPKDRLCAEAPPAPKTYGDVLRGTCSGCHSPMGGTNPDLSGDNATLRSILLGTNGSKVYVIPGDSSNSLIWQRITSATSPMPPSTSTQLTSEEKSLIQTWIDSGAN